MAEATPRPSVLGSENMAYPQVPMSTVTGAAMYTAIQKRLQARGAKVGQEQLQSLALDCMAVISANSSGCVSDASTELTNSPQRPFVFGV
jgi:hypothetical protein